MVELSYTDRVDVEGLQAEPRAYSIEFPADGLVALAERLGLKAVSRFVGNFTLQTKGDFVLFRGSLGASVTQLCVVSLEPFDSEVAEEIALDLVTPQEANIRDEEEDFLDPESPEYDVLDRDNLVPGEILAQTLSMALDPYPRKPDVELKAAGSGVTVNEGPSKRDNPFAALKGMTKD